MKNLIIIGNVSENPFVEDIAHHLDQFQDYSDLISLKSFLNTEFCPRFIVDEDQEDNIGNKLAGKTILLVSASLDGYSRDELAMRNCLIARAAKDNGADRVVLLEPDLYYSAQDRGPRKEHGLVKFDRDITDYKKFDGQPFSSRLYADLLKLSGVDDVITVHNHSDSVKAMFMDRFGGHFTNLQPAGLYADYLLDDESDLVDPRKLVLCAPDKGAAEFVGQVHKAIGRPGVGMITMDKVRTGEREVKISPSANSELQLEDLEGKDVVVLDDMVRTGKTIVEACKAIAAGKPNKIVFLVTHFYSSREGRANMNNSVISEIVTSTTIPQILNRDVQGRLRHKMVVLQIARWMSDHLAKTLYPSCEGLPGKLYKEDMSSKNPRWKKKHPGPLFSTEV